MVANAYILCIQEMRKEDCHEFEAVALYKVSSRRENVPRRSPFIRKGRKMKKEEKKYKNIGRRE